MTEESMFCDEKGKPIPRKNKFDMALYEEKVEKAHLRVENEALKAENARLKEEIDKYKHIRRLEKATKFAERYGFSIKQMKELMK